jgi:hypothetical protein
MIHANLVESGVFFGVAALTLLLVMFLYAVITADPEEATRTEASLIQAPVLPPPALPLRGAQTLSPAVFPAEAQPAAAGYAATPGPASSLAPPPEASRRRGPAAAFLFLIAGLALAVIGGGLFFGVGQDVTVCRNQALAICSDGFVVLHTAQIFGGALALGGIALVSTAIVLALR